MLLTGCSSRLKSDLDATHVKPQSNRYPESALSELARETFASVESFSANVAVPESPPFESNKQLNQLYCEWYRRGYAFAYVTGQQHIPDWSYHEDKAERAKLTGWFDGNSAGGLARRLKDIDSAVDRVMTNRSHSLESQPSVPHKR